MKLTSGVVFPNQKSKRLLSEQAAYWAEVALLVGLGALAVVLHQVFRSPLQLPGRHGIEWMALLVIGRSFSKIRGAGTLSGIGAATFSMLPVWGAIDDPFIWLIYLLPGVIMDVLVQSFPALRERLWFWVLLGGLAHLSKPLTRWLIQLATGFPYGSFLWGVAYPMATHFFFGLVGGLLGGLVVFGAQRLQQNMQQNKD